MTIIPARVIESAPPAVPAPSERSEAVLVPVVAVEALPALPAAPAQAAPPRALPVASSKSVASASSLPEALPRQDVPGDLLEPY